MDGITAIMIGFLGSLHCIGMCGPIALALPLNRSSIFHQIAGIVIYNLGRIMTYAMLGVVFGTIGENLLLFGAQQYFSIGMGILIILMALLPYSIERLFDITPLLSKFLNGVKQKMGFFLRKSSYTSLFGIGILNGLLPCGLVYFAIIGAVGSYNTWNGALYMMLFGLGTFPMMFSAAFFPGFVGIKWRNRIRKSLPYFAVLVGVLFIIRGLNLGIPYMSPQLTPNNVEAVDCHNPD